MSWGDELIKIRYFLRDPNGSVWSEAFLRHLYNDVQQDFQHKTNVLEDAQAQRVPAVYQYSYQFDWEWRFLPSDQSQFYQCLNQHDGGVFCHRWEPQQVTGIASDVADYGIHFTQAWESFTSETPGDLLRMRYPYNFNAMKFCAYDQEPIAAISKKWVQSTDPSHMTREGEPIGYYSVDQSDNSYVLYPRPSVSFVNELTGDGVAMFADGDTEDVTTGIVAVRIGSFDSDIGIPVDIVDVTSSIFMVYSVSPVDMRDILDEPEFPVFLRKYIRYGAISRAYGAQTDGRIKSLADIWGLRYQLGIQFVKRYLRNKKQDRDYRLTTRGVMSRRDHRHPRLPDSYPAVNP